MLSRRDQARYDARWPFDRFGDIAHTAAGVWFCFWAFNGISAVEVSTGVLLSVAVIRLPWTWRAYLPLRHNPVLWLLVAWLLVGLLSRLWTIGPGDFWWREWGRARFLVAILALWPVIQARRLFIAAMLLGFGAGLLSQVEDWWVARSTGVPLPFGRNGGWWGPVGAGQIMALGLAMHVPVLLLGRPIHRLIALAGVLACAAGMIASGTRAAWLAAMVVIAVAIVVALLRATPARHRALALAGMLTLAVALAGGASTWIAMGGGGSVGERVRQVVRDVDRARAGDLDSDNGLRVQMALWAGQAFAQRPILGWGLGSYRAWVLSNAAPGPVRDRFEAGQHRHAHNTPMHILATGGLVGLLLFGGAWAMAIWSGLKNLGPTGWRTWDAAPVVGLMTLVLIAPFDSITNSASMIAAAGTLMALCPWHVPGVVASRWDGSIGSGIAGLGSRPGSTLRT